jgi:large subunit ribosomal protein L23
MRNVSQILVKPIVTEKTHDQLDRLGVYAFVVANDANKIEIAHAVEKQFDVKVKSVRTMRYAGKERRVGRWLGRRASWKKAIVTLAEGTIDLFEEA